VTTLVRVHVALETPDGPPVRAASIFVFWGDEDAKPPLPGGGPIPDLIGNSSASGDWEFRMPRNATARLDVLGFGFPATTSEFGPLVRPGPTDETVQATVLLYRQHLSLEVAWSVATTSEGLSNAEGAHWNAAVSLGPAAAAYLEHLQGARLTVRWNNTQTSYADFAAGFAAGDHEPTVLGEDPSYGPLTGPSMAMVHVTGADAATLGNASRGEGLFASIFTTMPVVSAGDLPVQGTVELFIRSTTHTRIVS
jgi:hypothetical protein